MSDTKKLQAKDVNNELSVLKNCQGTNEKMEWLLCKSESKRKLRIIIKR